MRHKTIVMSALVILVLCVGCSQRLIDFTIISSKNIDLSKADTFVRGKDRMSGKDTAHMVLFIPIGNPNMKEACDRAIEMVPGAVALVDGVVTFKFFTFGLYGQSSYLVEGTPLIDPSLASVELQSNYMVAYYHPETDEATLVYTSAEEYAEVKRAAARGKSDYIEEILKRAEQ